MKVVNEVAEAHGVLCGLLCNRGSAGKKIGVSAWLDCLTDDVKNVFQDVFVSQGHAAMEDMFEQAVAQLDDDEASIELLLSDDEHALVLRADNLSSWCEGFLYGLIAGHEGVMDDMSAEVEEVIRDLSEISRISHDSGYGDEEEGDEGAEGDADDEISSIDSDEEDEFAFAEVVGHVCVCVELLYKQNCFASAAESEQNTLH